MNEIGRRLEILYQQAQMPAEPRMPPVPVQNPREE
jgi:hypothetical protein